MTVIASRRTRMTPFCRAKTRMVTGTLGFEPAVTANVAGSCAAGLGVPG
jgi:hypothetical protein